MKFRGNYKDIDFEINVVKEGGLHFVHKSYELDDSDVDEFRSGDMAIFSLMITSHFNGETQNHYLPGRPLATDSEEMLEELDLLIEEEEILEQLEESWKAATNEDGPTWKLR